MSNAANCQQLCAFLLNTDTVSFIQSVVLFYVLHNGVFIVQLRSGAVADKCWKGRNLDPHHLGFEKQMTAYVSRNSL